MDQKIVYSKTGKGVLEIKNKAGKLSRELAKVLVLVDGKSAVGDIVAKSKLSDANLDRCLKQLEEGGYIKEFASLSGAMSSTSTSAGGAGSYVDDLDFTTQLSPGKRVYSNAASEFRSIESADRQRAEAEATRKRQAGEEQKKEDVKRQAREEAVRMARMEAERKAKEAVAIKARQQGELEAKRQATEMEKTTRDLAKILEAERQALDKADSKRNAEKARKAKEEAERKRREEEERKLREEAERKRREEERKRREEEERKRHEEEERKRREEEERKRREEEERKRREEEERKQREEEERKQREEAERKQREEEERKQREEAERKQREEEERKQRAEEERRQREEEERRQREEEERRQREEEERKQREEEERRQREEEERLRRGAEDRRREEEDARREEEDRRRREEEEARRAVEDEENRTAEEQESRQRDEEQRLRRDAVENLRREEEEEKRREEDVRRLREEEEWRLEEEAEKRREEDARRLREDEQQRRKEEVAAPVFNIGDLDLPSAPNLGESVSTSFEPSTSALVVNEDFAAGFEQQQEALRKRALEEERLRRKEEEAELGLERAQREEDARLEAEHRAAMEAEMRIRVEQEKDERTARERSKREEYERKIQEDEERKRQEAERKQQEDQERIDSDRKKREEELTHRRRQGEDADRRRAELKAIQKSGKVRSPAERILPKVIGLVAVVGLLIGAIHIVPLSGYIPKVEKIVSDKIGEPVTIGSMKISMLSGLQLILANVNVGATQDVSLNQVTVSPQPGSIFGDTLVINSIRADGGKVVKEALSRLPGWLRTSASDQRMSVRSIELRGVALELRTFKMRSVDADVRLSRTGKVTAASVRTADGKLAAEITPVNGRFEVSINANNWELPIGTPLELTDFTATGVASKTGLRLTEWQAGLYGGRAKGSGEISWDSDWQADAKFEFARIAADELLTVFTRTAKVSGNASGKGSFSARAGGLDTLLDRPSLRTSFLIRKGSLDGVDLVRALQAGSAGTQGGSTKFEELKGEATISNGRYSYKNVRLSAGILSADSNFDISSSQDVSGKVSVALRSSAQRMNANLNVTGSLKGVVLKP